MTPDEAREIIGRLGWRQEDLAKHAERSSAGTRNMLRGRSQIDDDLANWLYALKALLDRPPTSKAKLRSNHGAQPLSHL